MEKPWWTSRFFKKYFLMKVSVELFGAAREFSNKDFIELNLLQPSSIKDLKNELVKMIDDKFNGNQNFKKIVMSSAFCSENDNIVSDNFKIDKKQTFGIIPPVGGG